MKASTDAAGNVVDIAIVGMAGRFPGAASVDQFWANLRDGVESIRRLGDEELEAAGADMLVNSMDQLCEWAGRPTRACN